MLILSFVVVVVYDLLDRVEPILLGDCKGREACLLAAELLSGLDAPTLQHTLAERYYSAILPRAFYRRYVLFSLSGLLWCGMTCGV